MPDWRRLLAERLGTGLPSGPGVVDVLEEIEQHLEDRYHDLRGRGVSPEAAERQALDEATADGALSRWLASGGRGRPGVPAPPGEREGLATGLLHDARYAVRLLLRTPGFAAAAVAALGLGAGAAIGVFTLLQAVVLRPLPYAEPDRLVRLWETKPREGLQREAVSPVTFLDYRSAPGIFEDAAAWWVPERNLVDDVGDPIRVATVEASENLFDVLGVAPALGPGFPRDSTLHGDVAQAVIGDALWRSRFGASPDILGTSLQLNGRPYEIVGVMPPGFDFPDGTQVWERLDWPLASHSRAAHFMGAVGRLAPGVTLERANAALQAVARTVAEDFPQTNEDWNVRAVALSDEVTGVFRPGLLALFGASGLLLLIACINVANLLLARAAARQGEVAVRSALGASRVRLMRQFLMESLLLATAAAVLGLGMATAVVNGFLAWSPIEIPRAEGVAIDGWVLLFTAAVIVGTAVVFGLLPAARSSRADLQRVLRETSRGQVPGRRGRAALVVAEIALSVVLLSGAGLLVRSVDALLDEDVGVRADGQIVVDLQLPEQQYGWYGAAAFYGNLLDDLRRDPRLAGVGLGNFLPLETGWRGAFGIPGVRPLGHFEQDGEVQYHSVSEGFFEAMRAELRAGTVFAAQDDSTSRPVAIVNETFAERFLGGPEAAVGQTLLIGSRQIGPLGRRLTEGTEHDVVGVVADIRNVGLTAAAEPALYIPFRQFPFFKAFLVVRPAAGEQASVEAVRAAVRRLDPGLPLGAIVPFERVLGEATDANRVIMLLMLGFAGLALVLSVVGLYGSLSYSVGMRRREIGIRLALGARRVDVLSMVVRQGVSLGVAGIALGLLVAAMAGRLLGGLLYRVGASDAATLGAVAGLVLAVAAAAALAPARRAAATEPMKTLRQE